MGQDTRILALLLRGPRGTDIPVATSVLGAKVLFSKYLSPVKGTKTPSRNGRF